VIKQEVIHKIADGFAEFDFPDLDTVLDVLYSESKFTLLPQQFVKFVTKDLNVNISETDLKLFM